MNISVWFHCCRVCRQCTARGLPDWTVCESSEAELLVVADMLRESEGDGDKMVMRLLVCCSVRQVCRYIIIAHSVTGAVCYKDKSPTILRSYGWIMFNCSINHSKDWIVLQPDMMERLNKMNSKTFYLTLYFSLQKTEVICLLVLLHAAYKGKWKLKDFPSLPCQLYINRLLVYSFSRIL